MITFILCAVSALAAFILGFIVWRPSYKKIIEINEQMAAENLQISENNQNIKK